MANTSATFGAGRSLEFVATFGAAPFQHVAFTDNFNSTWAMFSTRGSSGGQLYASTNPGNLDVPIGAPGQYVGSPHLYRIQWNAGQVQYYVDGNLVHTEAFNPGTPNLNVAASDFNAGGPELSVDWLRISPYPSAGTFTSRVFDAGQAADWGALDLARERTAGDRRRAQRPHGQHPDAGRELERLHPDRIERRRHPRQLALRAVPGRADRRPGRDGRPPGRLDRLQRGRGHHCAHDHRPQPGAGRHRRPTEHQRRGPVQRSDEPGDDRRLHRSPAKAGGGQRRAGDA